MNVIFFLIPKNDVIYLKYNATMRQALERMEFHRYSAIPLIDEEGHYIGTLTEGDLLWKLKNTPGLTFETHKTSDLMKSNSIFKTIRYPSMRILKIFYREPSNKTLFRS